MKHYRPTRKILVSLPDHLVDRLDEAADAFNMCRLDVIRRSLMRDLSFVLDYEVPQITRLKSELDAKHRKWRQIGPWGG